MDDRITAWSALAAAPQPVGLYAPFVCFGDLVALSAISSARDGQLVTGKVGRDLDLEAARDAVVVRGYVNAAKDFPHVHKVIDAEC